MKEQDYVLVQRLSLLRIALRALVDAGVHLEGPRAAEHAEVTRVLSRHIASDEAAVKIR